MRVDETLQELVERRLREMGRARGRDEPLTLLEVWESLPEDDRGKRAVSYEICRRIARGVHRNIGDQTADALATMLDAPVGEVLRAAGQRPRLGRFDLPRRADRLTEREREAVVSVVDAILNAAGEHDSEEHPVVAARRSRRAAIRPRLADSKKTRRAQ